MTPNNPKKQLPLLEIFSNSVCPRHCPRCDKNPIRKKYPNFQFTPEMAQTFANKLDEYDCMVERVQFVGGEPLMWKHLEKCVDILRDSGKVASIKMTTALPDTIDMKYYEAIFDCIGVSDYGTNRNMIERYAIGNPKYEIHDKVKHHFHPRGRIPGTIPAGCYCHVTWLFGEDFYFCPMTGSILMSEIDLKMTQEERDFYCWTQDEFFQNIQRYHSGFGQRNICEACHVNSNVRNLIGEAEVDDPDLHGKAIYNIR